MDVEIGTAAGEVYHFLDTHGPSTVGNLRKGTGQKDTIIYEALGWLAREEKVARETRGKTTRWMLA